MKPFYQLIKLISDNIERIPNSEHLLDLISICTPSKTLISKTELLDPFLVIREEDDITTEEVIVNLFSLDNDSKIFNTRILMLLNKLGIFIAIDANTKTLSDLVRMNFNNGEYVFIKTKFHCKYNNCMIKFVYYPQINKYIILFSNYEYYLDKHEIYYGSKVLEHFGLY